MTDAERKAMERVAARMVAAGRDYDAGWLRIGASGRIDPAVVAEMVDARAEVERLAAFIRSIEWAATGDPFNPNPPSCPVCDGRKPRHWDGCRFAAMLETLP